MTGDITEIGSIWPVLAIAVVVGTPALFSWLNSREAKHAAQEARDTMNHETQPNSGGSMKDSLNRIEATQKDQGAVRADVVERVTIVERAAEKRGSRRMWWK